MIEELKQKLAAEAEKLQYELNVTLPKEIRKAVELGDLRENSEYKAALERQQFVQARLGQLRERLSKLSSIDMSQIPDRPRRPRLEGRRRGSEDRREGDVQSRLRRRARVRGGPGHDGVADRTRAARQGRRRGRLSQAADDGAPAEGRGAADDPRSERAIRVSTPPRSTTRCAERLNSCVSRMRRSKRGNRSGSNIFPTSFVIIASASSTREAAAIGAVRRQRVEHVGDAHDARR